MQRPGKMEALLYDYCVLTEKYFGISLHGLKAVAEFHIRVGTLFLEGLSMKKMTAGYACKQSENNRIL
jgi:hypothetical protein